MEDPVQPMNARGSLVFGEYLDGWIVLPFIRGQMKQWPKRQTEKDTKRNFLMQIHT